MSQPARRALVVGVQRYLAELPDRPGTTSTLRRIAAAFVDPLRQCRHDAAWEVRTLLADEASDDRRPLLANILDQLSWLGAADGDAILLFSAASAVDGDGRRWLLPADARPGLLARTAIGVDELLGAAGPRATVIIDSAVPDSSAPDPTDGRLMLAAGGEHEAFLESRGPTRFLHALQQGLLGEAAGDDGEVTAASLAAFTVDRLAAAAGAGEIPRPWHVGVTNAQLLRARDGAITCGRCSAEVTDSAATFCPACGASLGTAESLDRGRYRLVRPLGAGGMGQVYLAEDTRLGTRRALKLLTVPPELGPDEAETLRARLLQEARAAQALGERSHHVVRVFDVGFSPERGEPFLVMELLEGRTLRERLQDGPMSARDAVALALDIAETLAVAHADGIIHRDLKPDNVMLVRRGDRMDFPKLLDFGLAKMRVANVQTESGLMMGTLQYMPPEQLRGDRVDARVDVFSLGAVLYECLTGVRANPGRSQGEIFGVLLDTGVRPIIEVAPDLPAPLVDLVNASTALAPDRRPADGAALAEALRALRPTVEGHTEAPPRPTTEPTPAESSPSEAALGLDDTVASDPNPAHAPGAEHSLARGEISLPPSAQAAPTDRRRGRAAAGALVLLLGLAGGAWLLRAPAPTPATTIDAATPRRAVAGPSPDADLAPPGDAAPPLSPDGAQDAAPEGPRPTRPAALPTGFAAAAHDDTTLRWRGGTPGERWAAAIASLTLSDEPDVTDPAARRAWQRATPSVRRWLATGLPEAPFEAPDPDTLVIPRDRAASLHAARPRTTRLNGIGTWLVPTSGLPIIARDGCGADAQGDRVKSATWSILGYTRGSCEGRACADSLARALHEFRGTGEYMRVRLTLGRPTGVTGEDEEQVERAGCRFALGR
jgi:serine/threonine-protein kinase